MLSYLHDIRNKLTLISGQITTLSKKYGEDDFMSIRTNLVCIIEIINEAYRHINTDKVDNKIIYSPVEFVRQMDLFTEAAELLFPLTFINEVSDYRPKQSFHLEFNIGLIFQVIENAIDNSVRANSSKIIIRLFETTDFCIYELVDNGTGKSPLSSDTSLEGTSIIPHGIGKEIMIQNMQDIGGKVEWNRRLDYSGMIVRLYFPKK